MVVPLAHQHDAGRPAGVEQLAGQVKPVGVHPGQQHVVATGGQRIGQAADQAQEKRVGQRLAGGRVVGHDHRHRLVLLEAQVLRTDVDAVVQRQRQLMDAPAGLGIDQ